MEKIEVEIIDKHRNYLEKYIPDDLYWGIGIENEVYLEFEKSYDIETVVEAAKYFSGDDRVLFVLAGNGSKFLEAEIESKNLKNFKSTQVIFNKVLIISNL